jgi:hypothetical protein
MGIDVATATQVVGTLGFPIVACAGMGWYIVKVLHPAISKIGDALNNNTIAITKLAEKIDNGKEV